MKPLLICLLFALPVLGGERRFTPLPEVEIATLPPPPPAELPAPPAQTIQTYSYPSIMQTIVRWKWREEEYTAKRWVAEPVVETVEVPSAPVLVSAPTFEPAPNRCLLKFIKCLRDRRGTRRLGLTN